MGTSKYKDKKTAVNALTVLFNKTCVLLLSLLYNNPAQTFYLREISRHIGSGAGIVQREIAKLVAAGLVVRQSSGRQVYYQANSHSHVFNEIRGLVIKTFGVADIVRQAISNLSSKIDFAFIYGSQADGTSSNDSDIDLMIVGAVEEMKLHKAVANAEKKLNKSVNYSIFTLKEFKKRKKEKKGFLDRVIAGEKIMLIGDEDEI